jgi:hypothetical protein
MRGKSTHLAEPYATMNVLELVNFATGLLHPLQFGYKRNAIPVITNWLENYDLKCCNNENINLSSKTFSDFMVWV